MDAESVALSIFRMRCSAFQAASMLALVVAPAAMQQSLDAGGLVYGLVGGGFRATARSSRLARALVSG